MAMKYPTSSVSIQTLDPRRDGPSVSHPGFSADGNVLKSLDIVPKVSTSPYPSSNGLSYSKSTKNGFKLSSWTDEKEKVARGPYDYVASEPGKGFRTTLLKCFNAWLNVRQESLTVISNAINMLHTASLLVDDIQDNSDLRRGRPVAHHIFGEAQTINSANYVYFLALNELMKLNNPEAIDIYTTEMMYLHRGQGMDLYWRDTLTCPTEEDYLEMVSNKTGGLFRLAVRLMQAESPTSIDCLPLVQVLGLVFQIADDYKNLCNDEYGEKKGFAEDLTEGKFSFPVIHSIQSDPTDLQLLHILQQKPTNEDVKRYAVRHMESTGSFEYTRRVIAELLRQARDAVDQIDPAHEGSEGMLALLDKMTRL